MKRKTWKNAAALLAVVVIMLTCLTGCGTADYEKQFSEPDEGDTIAVIHTNLGDITVRFFEDEAPKAVENFITHAQEGYYDGLEFFRVIDDFMIQSGDPENTGRGGESIWGGTFEDEMVDYLSPYYGALCMANKGTDTNGSQFFIVTSQDKDTTTLETVNETAAKAEKVDQAKIDKYKEVGGAMWLDSQVSVLYESAYPYTASSHTVFGQVLDGMDVAEAIAALPTYTAEEADDATIDDPEQTDVLENKPKEEAYIINIEITTYQPE